MLCTRLGKWLCVYPDGARKQVCPLPHYAGDYFPQHYHHHRGCPWFDTGYRHFLCLDSLSDIIYSVDSPDGESLSRDDIQVTLDGRLVWEVGRLNRYLSVPNVARTLARMGVLVRDYGNFALTDYYSFSLFYLVLVITIPTVISTITIIIVHRSLG